MHFRKSTFILVLTLLHVYSVECRVVGFFILPHGGIALDPSHFNTTNKTAQALARQIHHACTNVGKIVADLEPDSVVLSTPHGIADQDNFVLYFNPHVSGFADTDNCQCPPCCYNLTGNGDVNLTRTLYQKLQNSFKVSTLSAFGLPGESSESFPLRWGEVIPLYFIGSLLGRTKLVILSQPSRRYIEDVQMIPELLKLGSAMWNILEQTEKKVVVIISADLAHTHQPDGPYGYSNASEPFDKACGHWVSSQNEKYLLEDAKQYVDKALSCGYTGLVMLQGLLSASKLTWTSHLHIIGHPSYYGMMVGSYLPQHI